MYVLRVYINWTLYVLLNTNYDISLLRGKKLFTRRTTKTTPNPPPKKKKKPMTSLLGITLNAHLINSLSATFLIVMNTNMGPGTIVHIFHSSTASYVCTK